MIVIAPQGGHGTVFITKRVNMLVRPDTVFGDAPHIRKKVLRVSSQWWNRSGGIDYHLYQTIEWNLLRVLRQQKDILLCGRCSIRHKFLTDNKIDAMCIVRDPINAYVSYLHHQHPEHARAYGGFDNERCVRWWCEQWNAIVTDFITSGNPIYHYETLIEELPNGRFKDRIKLGWNGTHSNRRVLSVPLEELLMRLVGINYDKLYG